MSWQTLHNLRHVNHKFQLVSSEFVLAPSPLEIVNWNTNDQYQQSIQMFAFIPELVSAIVVAFLTMLTIISCLKYSVKSNQPYQHQSSFSRNCRFFLGLLAFVMLAMTGFAGYQMYITSGTLKATLDNSHQPYTAAVAWGQLLNSTLQHTNAVLKSMNTTEFQKAVGGLEATITSADANVQTYISAASRMSWGRVRELSLYRTNGLYVGIGVLVFSFLCFLLAACTPPLRHYRTRTKSHLCFGAFNCCIYVVCLVVCILFAASVQVADGCANPHKVVIEVVNRTHVNPTADTFKIVDYYTYCDSAHSHNPLVTNVESAYNTLFASRGAVYNLTNEAKQSPTYKGRAIALETDFNTTLSDLNDLDMVLKCDVWHGYFLTIHRTTCEPLLRALCLFYLMLTVFIALLCLRSWICCSEMPKGLQRRLSRIRARKRQLASAQAIERRQFEAAIVLSREAESNHAPLLEANPINPPQPNQNVHLQFDDSIDPLAYSLVSKEV